MATQTDMATQVLQDLFVLDGTETADASDAATVVTKYTQRLVMLAEDNYADWDADSIPDAAMPGLVRVIAYECAPVFGKDRNKLVEPNGDTWEDRGLAMLRRYMRQKATYEPVPALYF